MTGPEHYLEAERLLAMSKSVGIPRAGQQDPDFLVRVAQVHATLALAAASCDPVRLPITITKGSPDA